jgi:hypothetical protein
MTPELAFSLAKLIEVLTLGLGAAIVIAIWLFLCWLFD